MRRNVDVKFTEAEIAYLASQTLGRLATMQRNGTLQNSPVGFTYNADLDTVDITGHGMSGSQKYRNVGTNSRVAFVVDDIASRQPWRIRCLEIRGTAEAVPPPAEAQADPRGFDGAIIRITPTRIISFGLTDSDDPFRDGANKRDV
jgi:pyridoxamine 5'-phosphate oxidase family protein